MSKKGEKNNIFNVKASGNNSEAYIYEYFEDMKREVDLRREDLIQMIHNYSAEIITSIESIQSECLKMSNDINNLKTEVENSKKNLNSLIKNGNKQKSDTVDNEAYANLVEYYNDLFNTYSFDYVETDIKDVFGYFSETKGFDSTIMDIGLQKQLIKICDLPLGKKWELKYRASKDGFKSTDFHTKCDGIGNTLTVIKAKSGNIFGGFTEQEWHSIGEFVTDPKAFIFSLVNKEEKPFKILCSNGGRDAIYCGLNRGPCFGGEGYCIKDICIDTDSNLNKTSDCDLGFSYRHPDYVQDTDKAQNILAGSQYFETLEIEVFAKQLDTLTV